MIHRIYTPRRRRSWSDRNDLVYWDAINDTDPAEALVASLHKTGALRQTYREGDTVVVLTFDTNDSTAYPSAVTLFRIEKNENPLRAVPV